MAQRSEDQTESVAQMAGRILTALRNGENAGLGHELERARGLAAQNSPGSTRQMEELDALAGAVESLGDGRRQCGAVRLLEHLASAPQEPGELSGGKTLA